MNHIQLSSSTSSAGCPSGTQEAAITKTVEQDFMVKLVAVCVDGKQRNLIVLQPKKHELCTFVTSALVTTYFLGFIEPKSVVSSVSTDRRK